MHLHFSGSDRDRPWVTVRPVSPEDRNRILVLLHEAERAEAGRELSQFADVDNLLATPGLDLDNRVLVVVGQEGMTGLVALHPAPQPGELRAQLLVSPAGTGDLPALLAELDEWVSMDRHGPGPVVVTLFELPGFLAGDVLRQAGWSIVHNYTRLSAALENLAPRPPSAERVHIRASATRADMATVHSVLEEAVAGHWKHRRRSFADFLADQESRAGHDPSLWLLAEDGQPVGALIARDPAERAWIAWLGVSPDHRGQGIAQALLGTAFEELRRRGHATVGVDVDTHNESGAVEVYRRAGMKPVWQTDQWSKTYV